MQETYYLDITAFGGQVVQPSDDLGDRSIEVSISFRICLFSVCEKLIDCTSFVDCEYFGVDASKGEDVARFVSMFVLRAFR